MKLPQKKVVMGNT